MARTALKEFPLHCSAVEELKDLGTREGTTVVIVSHDERLREVADRSGSKTATSRLSGLSSATRLRDAARSGPRARLARAVGRASFFSSRGCHQEFEDADGTRAAVALPQTRAGLEAQE